MRRDGTGVTTMAAASVRGVPRSARRFFSALYARVDQGDRSPDYFSERSRSFIPAQRNAHGTNRFA